MSIRSKSRPNGGARRVAAASVGLALALVGAGCGSGGEASEGTEAPAAEQSVGTACPVGAHEDVEGVTEITVWHSWTGITAATLEEIARTYNASQDRVVVTVEAQGDFEELLAKYQAALADRATLPDIVIHEATALRFMVDSDTAVPASECIEADPSATEFYDQVLPAVTGAYTVEGELWPAAFSVAQEVLYANQDHLEAAGLSTADLPETLDELRSVAESIRDARIPGVQEPFVGLMDSWFFENQLTGAGQAIADRDNGRDGPAAVSELDNDRSVEILEWLAEMERDGLYRPIPHTQPLDTLLSMALGTSSMLIGTSTAITSIDAAFSGTLSAADLGIEDPAVDPSGVQLEEFAVAVAPTPGLDAPGRGRIGGMAWYLLQGDDEAVAAAWDFISFSNQVEQQVRWTLEGSYLPVSDAARNDPAMVEAFRETRRGRWLATAADSLTRLDPEFPGPVIGPYAQLTEGVRTAIERVVLEDQPVSQAVGDLDTAFQSDLTAYLDELGS